MGKRNTTLTLRCPENIKIELEQLAESKGTSVSELIFQEILLELQGSFIRCPGCNKIIGDEREIPLIGIGTIKCERCENEFIHDFGGK
jgi:hypothetical protein